MNIMILSTLPAFVIPAVFLLVFAAIAWAVRKSKSNAKSSRSTALELIAPKLDLSFSSSDHWGLLAQLKGFELFSHERLRLFRGGKISNVMRGMVGQTEVTVFDYSYVVSTGKSTRTVAQTVFFANDKSWYLPSFILKPETIWHKFIQLFGLQDIDLEDNEAFSGKYWLKGDGSLDDLIREKFSPDVQQFIQSKPPLHLEGNNYYLIAYRPGQLVGPSVIKDFFQQGLSLTHLFQTSGKTEMLDLATLKSAIPLPDPAAPSRSSGT